MPELGRVLWRWGRRRTSERAASDEPPRLVLRFAIFTAVALAAAAASILMFVRHFNTAQAERSATVHARFVADSVLRDELRPSDFKAPVRGVRRAKLDRLFEHNVLIDGLLLAALYSPDGTVTYSNEHALIGTVTPNLAEVRETLGGTILSHVTTMEKKGGAGAGPKVLTAYVPMPFPRSGGAGVVALYQDYAPIARAAKEAFLPVAGVLEVVLILLYIVLIPVLRRVTRRIGRQVQEIQHRALHDDLTGLPNRTLFRDRIELAVRAAAREGDHVGVMLIDLDRFKEINDTLGHHSGDLLLKELGSRLTHVLRGGETFARLGGDEFGVLLPKATPVSSAEVAQRVLGTVAEPFVLRGISLEVEASIGVSLAADREQDVDTLLRHADVAMYLAKDARCGYAFYDAAQDPNDAERLALVGELRRAIDQSELVLYFQPQADLLSRRVRGVEALVRWQHPRRGLLGAEEFVPLAERTGLIKPLSRYVLELALRQCRAWQLAGIELDVAVNLTMANLLDADLPAEIEELLTACDVAPHRLGLEITESMIMADPFRVRNVLTRLSEMGVRVAIDDFGTGYSSLAYLKRLPVDELKIDKSFVVGMAEDPSDATIVRSTIDLARNLGLEVVAEGVESAEVCATLRGLGCNIAQGYYVGRPVPAAELAATLGGTDRLDVPAESVPAAAAQGASVFR